ncbi:MAG: class I SAM-dependent methyltransferase [Candidatus Goldiibacteriota bacterium]
MKGKKRKFFMVKAVFFGVRDIFSPPKKTLKEAALDKGMSVLDFGAGTGSFAAAAAGIVGSGGKVYALDSDPEAAAFIKKRTAGKPNVFVIESSCAAGLPDSSVDRVLLYDVFHLLENKRQVLDEIYRVMKPDGRFSFSDHHMNDGEIRKAVLAGNLFDFFERGKKTYTFKKI